ncbi:MAG: YggT family protein [Peptococcaceae bacterium]|nr:YggT family protein [Peptococcaceae bacterium]
MNMLYVICNFLLQAIVWIVIARVILSWIPHNPENSIIRALYSITEPLLKPFRFARIGMMDLSPILLFVMIMVIQRYVLPAVFGMLH